MLAVAGLWLLLNKTAFGRIVRAGVQNPDMVGALGISLAPVMATVVAIGVGLAALAGVALAPIRGVHPAMGSEIITAAFVIVVIGGLGSFWGVVLASIVVGVVRGLWSISSHPWPRPRCTSCSSSFWCGRAASWASASSGWRPEPWTSAVTCLWWSSPLGLC